MHSSQIDASPQLKTHTHRGKCTYNSHARARSLHAPALFTILPRVLFGRAGAVVTIPGNIRANSIVVFTDARVVGTMDVTPDGVV